MTTWVMLGRLPGLVLLGRRRDLPVDWPPPKKDEPLVTFYQNRRKWVILNCLSKFPFLNHSWSWMCKLPIAQSRPQMGRLLNLVPFGLGCCSLWPNSIENLGYYTGEDARDDSTPQVFSSPPTAEQAVGAACPSAVGPLFQNTVFFSATVHSTGWYSLRHRVRGGVSTSGCSTGEWNLVCKLSAVSSKVAGKKTEVKVRSLTP